MTKTSIPIEQRYGKRVYDVSEYKEFGPIQKGDVFWEYDCWKPYEERVGGALHGGEYSPSARPISVGPGFELVGLDVALEEGDEVFNSNEGFWSAVCGWGGVSAGECINQCKTDSPVAFRRRKSDSLNRWIRISDRIPKAEEYPVWCSDGKDVGYANRPFAEGYSLAGHPCSCTHGGNFDETITHWQPKPKEVKPAPPAPEKSEEEIAFEKVLSEVKLFRLKISGKEGFQLPESYTMAKMFFDAGKAFQKGQKCNQ